MEMSETTGSFPPFRTRDDASLRISETNHLMPADASTQYLITGRGLL
jgi:hypothetical protein